MPPKHNPLKAIRRQVAQDKRLRASALEGSGFRNLQSRNAQRNGLPLPDREDELSEWASQQEQRPKPRKVVKRKKKTVPKARSPPPTPALPIVESWSSAGGETMDLNGKQEASVMSKMLGVAQIASWRKDEFIASLKDLVKGFAEHIEITAKTVNCGGESRTDVYMKFRSELVAEAAMEGMQGAMLGGRRLQVRYA